MSVDMSRRQVLARLMIVIAVAFAFSFVTRLVADQGDPAGRPPARQKTQQPAVALYPPGFDVKITKHASGWLSGWSGEGRPDYDAVIRREGTGPGREFVPLPEEELKHLVSQPGFSARDDPASIFTDETGWVPLARGRTGEQGYVHFEDLTYRREKQVVNAYGKLLGYFSDCVGYETPEQYEARKESQSAALTC